MKYGHGIDSISTVPQFRPKGSQGALLTGVRCLQNNSMPGRSSGGCSREHITRENDSQMLNIVAQQACCSQDSHSVVRSHSEKMVVSESLKALGKRTQGKGGAKPAATSPNEARQAPGSQPSIMKFFRRD